MHCCQDMNRHTGRMCDEHDDPYECPDYVIVYSSRFDEYGLVIHDGGCSSYTISYCPFCGEKLPASKRDRWFMELLELGYEDPLFDEAIPMKYKTDQWWREISG